MPAPIVFLDTETTGTGPDDQPWEIAAIRRDPDGAETELHLLVEHDVRKVLGLPREFRIDWATRFDLERAIPRGRAGCKLSDLITAADEPPVIVGANPSFDLRMIAPLFEGARLKLSDLIHYRPVDVGALAYGYLAARAAAGAVDDEVHDILERGLPWSSDELSRALGVDPDDFERHAAMGDVRWVKAIYDRVTGASASPGQPSASRSATGSAHPTRWVPCW